MRGKDETQLVLGEEFEVESEDDGWCKGVCLHDGYKGYVQKQFLSQAPFLPTHIVTAARSALYKEPSIKSSYIRTLGFGSRIAVQKEGEKFAQTEDGSWIYLKHLSPLSSRDEDYVTTAKKFLETPYYWGGRSGFGIDCSGLVQVSLARAGLNVPRDTEEQADFIGQEVPHARTSDFVFFKGHVGIMVDDENILHANAFHMKVSIEPRWMVEERSGGISSIRRIT